MTPAASIYQRRVQVLDRAGQTNVTEACRTFGISRTTYYGLVSPACSAIVQQFLRGRSESSPPHERLGVPSGLHPGEPARDPAHHLVEQLPPAGRVDHYAVACGHRLMLGSHNTGSSTVAAYCAHQALM